MEWAIEAENIVKNYGNTRALDNLTLRVKKGDFYGFLGPNGAGKTTFVKILLDLVFSDKGYANILGINTKKVEAREKVGFLPENMYVHEFLTIEEFMLFHSRLLGMSRGESANDIKRLLKLTAMYNDRKKKMGELSKGMKQRVGIAQALLNSPELLILDEPTSGLDPIGIKEVRDILLKLKNSGTTVFINSHLLSEIEKTCDSVAILNKGKIVKSGNKSDFSEENKFLEVKVDGLTEEMIQALKKISMKEIIVKNNVLKIIPEKEQDSLRIHETIINMSGKLLSISWKGESLEELFYRLVKEEE